MAEPPKPAPPPPQKPARTLSYGQANPKQGGGKYRPAPAKSDDD
jgi:hypothetical protein